MGLRQTTYLPLDEVRTIPILDVYNAYIGGRLLQRGRAYWSRCSWHGNDSSASLKIYPDQNSWWCYGCGFGGSQIDMAMKALNCDFKTAVERLCQDFNIDNTITTYEFKKKITENKKKQNLNEAFEDDFNRTFFKLADLNRILTDLSKKYSVCFRYPSIFMYQLKTELILEDMTDDRQEVQIQGWRQAKKVFPWLT